MKYSLRFWKCSKCGLSNKTAVGPDSTVKCDGCDGVTRISEALAWHDAPPRLPPVDVKIRS